MQKVSWRGKKVHLISKVFCTLVWFSENVYSHCPLRLRKEGLWNSRWPRWHRAVCGLAPSTTCLPGTPSWHACQDCGSILTLVYPLTFAAHPRQGLTLLWVLCWQDDPVRWTPRFPCSWGSLGSISYARFSPPYSSRHEVMHRLRYGPCAPPS